MLDLRLHLLHDNVASHVALEALFAKNGRIFIPVKLQKRLKCIAVDRWAWFRIPSGSHPFTLSQKFELFVVVLVELALNLLELSQVDNYSLLSLEITRVVGKDLLCPIDKFYIFTDAAEWGHYWVFNLLLSRFHRDLCFVK